MGEDVWEEGKDELQYDVTETPSGPRGPLELGWPSEMLGIEARSLGL